MQKETTGPGIKVEKNREIRIMTRLIRILTSYNSVYMLFALINTLRTALII